MQAVYALMMLSGVVVFQVGLWSLHGDVVLRLAAVGYLLLLVGACAYVAPCHSDECSLRHEDDVWAEILCWLLVYTILAAGAVGVALGCHEAVPASGGVDRWVYLSNVVCDGIYCWHYEPGLYEIPTR